MVYVKREFKNGTICKCGPPMRAGAYTKWNWCAPCNKIYDKDHKSCPECHQLLRWKAKGNSNWTWKQ